MGRTANTTCPTGLQPGSLPVHRALLQLWTRIGCDIDPRLLRIARQPAVLIEAARFGHSIAVSERSVGTKRLVGDVRHHRCARAAARLGADCRDPAHDVASLDHNRPRRVGKGSDPVGGVVGIGFIFSNCATLTLHWHKTSGKPVWHGQLLDIIGPLR